MSLALITAPTVEPVTLAEVKAQCRIDGTAEDTLLDIYIKAARRQAEHYTGRAFLPQTWELRLDAFPAAEIQLPLPPVASITSIKYLDTAGVEQTLSGSLYTLDAAAEPGWVLPAAGAAWPDTFEGANAVRVRFVAGYSSAAHDALASVRLWMLLAIATAFRNRETLVIAATVEEVPRMAGIGLLDSLIYYG